MGHKLRTKPEKSHSMHGNALFLILIAVALFAALSYAITTSSRNSGDISREQVLFDAEEFVSIGRQVRDAAQRLMIIGGCDLTELSFDWSPGSGGEDNPNAPGDLSCHIFADEGGGVEIPDDLHTSSGTPGWIEVNHTRVDGLGSDSTANNCEGCELVFWRYFREEEICAELNKQFLGDSTVPTLSGSFPPSNYDGTFTASEYITAFPGEENFCFMEGGGQLYYVYLQVVVPR